MEKANLKITEPPRAKEELSREKCPQCGCARIFMIEVKLESQPEDSALPTIGWTPVKLTGYYAGCPACTFTSEIRVKKDQSVIRV